MSEEKIDFANMLADTVFVGMTRCEKYGMTWGCDTGCPVLQDGNCELQDDENKELYEEYILENE